MKKQEISKQTIHVEVPRELEGRLDGCMCGKKGKRKAYIVLDSFAGETMRGIAETTCPYCIRGMDFEYYIEFKDRKPVVRFKERKPYEDDRIVTFTPVNR